MKKRLAVALIFTLSFSTLLAINESIVVSAVPSTPEFSVKLVAYPYDVPPQTTTTIDEYSGEEIVHTTPGYHVENKSIEIKIKNPTNTPYEDSEGNQINTFYNVRVKGHFGSVWTELYPENQHREVSGYDEVVIQSSTEYTIIKCSADYDFGDQVDFQVQAREGYHNARCPFWAVIMYTFEFVGTYSPWSDTQTLKIGEPEYRSSNTITISTPQPTTKPTPAQTKTIPTQPTPSTTTTEEIEQTMGIFVFQNKNIIAFGVSCIITGVLLVALAFHRKIK